MSRPSFSPIVSRGLRALDSIAAPKRAHAHCDVPCGIYDPHLMQIAALTVIRMNQLMDGLEAPAADDKVGRLKYANTLSRHIAVKEEHAEVIKRELRIIFGDYFKPEHAEKYPDLMQLGWDILKAAGAAKQGVGLEQAQSLLAQCQRFAEIFWDSKGVATKKQASNQAVGGEIVVPA
jgi:nickel superoxide dismutase